MLSFLAASGCIALLACCLTGQVHSIPPTAERSWHSGREEPARSGNDACSTLIERKQLNFIPDISLNLTAVSRPGLSLGALTIWC
jgi:hypothetical protein